MKTQPAQQVEDPFEPKVKAPEQLAIQKTERFLRMYGARSALVNLALGFCVLVFCKDPRMAFFLVYEGYLPHLLGYVLAAGLAILPLGTLLSVPVVQKKVGASLAAYALVFLPWLLFVLLLSRNKLLNSGFLLSEQNLDAFFNSYLLPYGFLLVCAWLIKVAMESNLRTHLAELEAAMKEPPPIPGGP